MTEDFMISLIIGLIVIIFVLISIIRDKNKEIERLKKDWNFCRSLLNKSKEQLKNK